MFYTEGDGDRPWVCNQHGRFMRGDILCTLLAQWLGANHVVTPVSSNTAVELSGHFASTLRTRIQGVATLSSQAFIAKLSQEQTALVSFTDFSNRVPTRTNTIDDLRITLVNGDVLHLRPSGKSPELRCYTESSSPSRAQQLLIDCLSQMKNFLSQPL